MIRQVTEGVSHRGLPHFSFPFVLSVLFWTISHSAQLTWVPSQRILKSLCVLQSSLPVSWEMDFSSPHIPKAALKSHQKSVPPTSPVGRGEEGSPLHLPGWKDGLSPSAGQEDRGLKLLPKAGVTDQCCQSVLNSGSLKGGERIILIYFSTRKSAAPKGAKLAVSIDSFFFLLSLFLFIFFPAHCYCTH